MTEYDILEACQALFGKCKTYKHLSREVESKWCDDKRKVHRRVKNVKMLSQGARHNSVAKRAKRADESTTTNKEKRKGQRPEKIAQRKRQGAWDKARKKQGAWDNVGVVTKKAKRTDVSASRAALLSETSRTIKPEPSSAALPSETSGALQPEPASSAALSSETDAMLKPEPAGPALPSETSGTQHQEMNELDAVPSETSGTLQPETSERSPPTPCARTRNCVIS